ncbi:hypothetical protein BG006_010534 [Podila minutissima]|uniref:Uncharacterized protein n=1 Tax=Podila minutissima TaxID=64525 RepID=A0A9P5SQ40_9FUNG|nr:hypothetical protein BG006_010534 [Podila minutissima]
MASTHAMSGAFHKDESDNDYDHSHEDTSDSNEEFASASEGDDDLPWEPVVIRSPAISRASPIVPLQTPVVSPSQTISRGTPKLRERMRQSPVPYSKIVQAYLDPTTQLQSPEHVRMAWLQDQQETRQDSSDDDEDTHEIKIHTLQTHPTTDQTRTQSQIRPQPVPVRQDLHSAGVSKIHLSSTSVSSQSVHAIAPHLNPPASSYLTTRTHTTETIQTTEKTLSSISAPAESEEGESGWGFDDEKIQEEMIENKLEAHPESAEVITGQHFTEINHPGLEVPAAMSINLDEAIADDPEASWGFDEDISLSVESHLSPLAQDAIVPQEDTYPHIHNIHESVGTDDGWGYDDQGIEIAESAIQSELTENVEVHANSTHAWNDTAGQSISDEEDEDAWGNDLREVNVTGASAEDVQVPTQPPIPTSVSATFDLAQTELEVEDDAWGDDSQNIDIGLDNNPDIPNEAPQEEMLKDAWGQDNDLDITTQDISRNEHLESFPVGTAQDSHQLKVTQRSSIISEGTVDETSWRFDTDDIPETPLHKHVQHSTEEQHQHPNLSTQHVSTHFQADGSHLTQQEHAPSSTNVESDVHFDNHTTMDSKGQAELVISGFDDIEENSGDAWGYDDPVVEAHEPIVELIETAPADPVPLEHIHEVAQSSIDEAVKTEDVFEDHHHDTRDHISNGSDNEHDNEVREVLLAAQTSSFIDMEGSESSLGTGPMSSRSSRHMDSVDQDVSVEHHFHHESSVYGNSLLDDATGEQSSEVKDSSYSDTGSDIYNDLSTARAGMNASSNRLNEILDDDDYLEHMERGVPMNRSISTPYSDDEIQPEFIVEDELVELMERGERPLRGQALTHPSEDLEESEEADTHTDPIEHGIDGSKLATSFDATLELATEDSTEVASASETTTVTSTVILDTTLISSTEPELVETAHTVTLIDILSDVPELGSIEKAEKHVTTDLVGEAASLEKALSALEEPLEETVDSHEEQHSDAMHGLPSSDLQHVTDHQISLDVAIDEEDAWTDQDIQVAVGTTPRDTLAEVDTESPFSSLETDISVDVASNELHDEVHVQESHSDIVVQEHSEQSHPSSFKVGSILGRSESEQIGEIVEDAWGWDEQEVEVNLEIQKETPSVQSEEQSSGERSPTPGPSHIHDNEFASDPIESMFEKSHEDILFNSIDVRTGFENIPSVPIASKPFEVDDFFKNLELPTATSSEPTGAGASHLIEGFFAEPAPEVQETVLLDKEASSELLPSTQEQVIPTASIASPFKALEPEAEDQDYGDDGGAWDDESTWPDFAPKYVGDNQLSGEEQSGLENHSVVEELNELDLTRQDHGSLEGETDVPTSTLDVPQEEPSVQDADQWVDQVAAVETTEHVLDHAHKVTDIIFQPPQYEHVQEEHAATADPWDEDIDIEGLPVAEAETGPSHIADLIEAPIPFLGTHDLVVNDLEGDAWMEDIEGPSKVPSISAALVEEQPPASSSSILSALDDAIDDQTQGWGFDEDLAAEPIRDFKELVSSELTVPGASAPSSAIPPHDRLFTDDVHHLSTVANKLESPLSSPTLVFESILATTTTSSIEHHIENTEEHVEEEKEDAWDNYVNILEDTTKAHVPVDAIEPEENEKDACGDNIDGAALEELVKSQEFAIQDHEEDSWNNGDAVLEDLEEDLKAAIECQKAEIIESKMAPPQEDNSLSSHVVHETVLKVDNLKAGNINISAEALDDSWGFNMDDTPQEQPLSSQHLDSTYQSMPTPLEPVSLSKTQALLEVVSPVTAQKEQDVVTAEHSEEEDGLSPWQDVSPQSVSKRSDAAMSLGSEFESEYSVRSMDDEERTSPAPSHIHERSIDSSSSAACHSTTKISTIMSWTDLNDDEWQDEDTGITQELLHRTEAKTTPVSISSNSASASSTVKMPSVDVQELPDLSGADSWDFDQDDLESESPSIYMDKTPLASTFDLSRHTKTPDMSERSVLQHKTSFTSMTPSPGRTFSSYQSSLAGSVPPSPARAAIAPSTSSSSLSGNLASDSTAEVEDDSHLPLAIRQQRARLAARGKPLPPISKYKSTKDQTADKPAPSEAPALSPRLSDATSPVISFTSPVGAKSPVIPTATVSTDQKYLSPALQRQRERLEKKRAAAAAAASAPLSAARRLTVGEQSEQAVKPPSPLIAKAVLPSAVNKTVSPEVVKKIETVAFESLSSSTSSSGLSSRLMDAASPSHVEEFSIHQSPQQHESPILSSRVRRSSNTPTSPLQRSSFSMTSPTPSSPLANGFVRRSRDSHRPVVASGLEPQDTDVVRSSQSEVCRHSSRSSVSKAVLSSGWDNVTEDEEEPVVEEKKARFSGASFFKSSITSSSSQKEPDSVMDRSSPLLSSSSASGFYQQSVPGLDHDDDKGESIGSKSAFGIHTTLDKDPYGPASARSRKARSSFEGPSFDYKEDHEDGILIGSGPSPSVSFTSPTGAKRMSHRHDHHSSSSNNGYLGGSNSLLGDITSIMDEKKKYGGGQSSSNNHKCDDHDSDKKKAAASNASSSSSGSSANPPKSSGWSFGSWVSSAVAVATESIDKAYETLDPEYGRMKARGGGSPMSSEGGLEDHYNRKPGYVVGGSSLALGLASISTTGSHGVPVGAGSGSGKSSMSVERRASSDFAVSGSGSDAHAQHISHGHGHGHHSHGYGSPQQASPRMTRKNVGDSR